MAALTAARLGVRFHLRTGGIGVANGVEMSTLGFGAHQILSEQTKHR